MQYIYIYIISVVITLLGKSMMHFMNIIVTNSNGNLEEGSTAFWSYKCRE